MAVAEDVDLGEVARRTEGFRCVGRRGGRMAGHRVLRGRCSAAQRVLMGRLGGVAATTAHARRASMVVGRGAALLL